MFCLRKRNAAHQTLMGRKLSPRQRCKQHFQYKSGATGVKPRLGLLRDGPWSHGEPDYCVGPIQFFVLTDTSRYGLASNIFLCSSESEISNEECVLTSFQLAP